MRLKINYKTWIISTLVLGLISFVSFSGVFARSEGDTSLLAEVLYYLFFVLAFPFCFIFSWLGFDNFTILIVGLAINTIMYGFLIEWLASSLKRRQGKKMVESLAR